MSARYARQFVQNPTHYSPISLPDLPPSLSPAKEMALCCRQLPKDDDEKRKCGDRRGIQAGAIWLILERNHKLPQNHDSHHYRLDRDLWHAMYEIETRTWRCKMLVQNILKQNERKGFQMVQIECPKHCKPSVSCISSEGGFSFSHYAPHVVAFRGKKNWPSSMKAVKMEHFSNKMGIKVSKWSGLNATNTETLLSHPFLKLGHFPFLIIKPFRVITIGLPVWKWKFLKIPRTKEA